MGRAVKVDFEWSDNMEAVRAKVAEVHGIEGIGHTVTLTKFACLARSCVSDIVFAPHAKLAHPQAGRPVSREGRRTAYKASQSAPDNGPLRLRRASRTAVKTRLSLLS